MSFTQSQVVVYQQQQQQRRKIDFSLRCKNNENLFEKKEKVIKTLKKLLNLHSRFEWLGHVKILGFFLLLLYKYLFDYKNRAKKSSITRTYIDSL